MRKILIIIILLIGSKTTAQNTFPATGNVGIGTTTPNKSLDVRGPINFNNQLFNNSKLIYQSQIGNDSVGINSLASSVYAVGKKLYPDETFLFGTNSLNIYDNSATNTITINRVATTSSIPSKSGYMLKIIHAGNGQSPGYGGIYFGNITRPNATYSFIMKAKIPIGYTLNFASNPFGTGSSSYWATDNIGTGKWEDYVYIVKAGFTGTFSSTNFYYLTGSVVPNISSPLIWYISSATVYDLDDKIHNLLSENLYLTGKIGIGTINPSKNLTIAQNGATLRLESTSNPSGYYTELVSNYDAANTFHLSDRGTKTLGNKSFSTSLNNYSYLNSYYGVALTTGSQDPLESHIRLAVSQNGNIGIGTTTPSSKLHVVGNSTLSGANVKQTFDWTNVGAFSTGILGTTTADSRFSISSNSAGEALSVKYLNGNVGIATANPSFKLDVNGMIRAVGAVKLEALVSGEYTAPATLSYYAPNNGVYLNGTSNGWLRLNADGSQNTNIELYGGGSTIPNVLRFNTLGIERLRITSTGNIGIGSSAPQNKLEITGALNSSGLRFTNLKSTTPVSPSNSKALSVDANGDVILVNASTTTNPIDSTARKNIYFQSEGGSLLSSQKLSILNNGNVGIGITAPNGLLHLFKENIVSRTNTTDLLFLGSNHTSIGFNGFGTSIVDFRRTYRNATPHAINRISFLERGDSVNDLGGAITFSTKVLSSGSAEPTEKMRIDYNGNVGIGTATPDRKLVVNGDLAFDYGDNKSYNGLKRNSVATEYFNIITSTPSNIIHRFTGSAGADKLVIMEGGNVGIGTVTPNQKLHVAGYGQFDSGIIGNSAGLVILGSPNSLPTNGVFLTSNGALGIGVQNGSFPVGYKLAVAGNVIAEKVKVKKQSSGWPDFVFEPQYKLPDLFQIETYVKENKHLPEIPSAAEVEKDGQDLGEMNRLLLKKVEELTLYMIEMKKENQALKQRVEKLEK